MNVVDVEIKLLLEAIYACYGYDFRGYAAKAIKRRLTRVLKDEGLETFSLLQNRILHNESAFNRILPNLTITTTSMFRDPESFSFLRDEVFPFLSTYPVFKIWVAGCSTGEEAASLSMLLEEAGLLGRATIYATDINLTALESARSGLFKTYDDLDAVEDSYRAAGGSRSLFDHCRMVKDGIQLDERHLKNIVFSEHNLATDEVFSEVQLILCRNVLIYFDQIAQNRIVDLFARSLSFKGYMCLGPTESIEFKEAGRYFEPVNHSLRVFRRF